MKKTASLSIGIILICATAWAQNEQTKPTGTSTRVDFVRDITLDNDSRTEDVFIAIEPSTESLEVMISTTIEAGKLTIELFNPGGVKQGNFTVETQLGSGKHERVAGKLQKSLDEPQPGKWKVRITPSAVKGSVRIQTSHTQ